jgi:hypothetical protein
MAWTRSGDAERCEQMVGEPLRRKRKRSGVRGGDPATRDHAGGCHQAGDEAHDPVADPVDRPASAISDERRAEPEITGGQRDGAECVGHPVREL